MTVEIHIETVAQAIKLIGPIRIEVARQKNDVVGFWVIRVGGDPVFGRRMLVAEPCKREARNRVLRRRDAITLVGLPREEADRRRVPDPGRAIAVQFDVVAPPRTLQPNLSRRHSGFGAAQGVTGHGDSVVGVFTVELGKDLEDGFADAGPRFPEAVVNLAAFAKGGDVDHVRFEIFGPVSKGVGAA